MARAVTPSPPAEASTAVDLGLAVKRLRARMRAESLPADGWTISQLSTLARIVEHGPITASALAQAEHVRPQSIADIVAVLKAEGLTVAAPDATDGRKVLLSASADGRRLIESVRVSREAWLARAIEAVVEPTEHAVLEQAIDLLRRLAECDLHTATPIGWRG